jgi:TRAP transporter 4TM/12TM fusion protein
MRELRAPWRGLILFYAAIIAAAHLWLGGAGLIEQVVVGLLGAGRWASDLLYVPEPLELRGFHLASLMPLAFLLYPARKASPQDRPSALDWLLAAHSALPSLYILHDYAQINSRMEFVDPLTQMQFVLGVLAIVLLLEAIRRAVAPILAGIVAVSILYMYVGQWMPGLFNTRPFGVWAIIETVYFVPIIGGIYGPLTGIVAATIAMFILFGAFVQASGTGRLFGNFGAAVAGRFAGGPAKVEVITSGLFGTISGSTVSNVITTGSITIPLMKKRGFSAPVAAGIEASSSTGGALMPPVMGAAAFVMAEITNIPYTEIIVAAAIGAALYYFSILVSVHFESKRLGIGAMDEEDIPSWRQVAAESHLLLPIVLLVVLLAQRWSGNFAAFAAIVACVVCAAFKRETRMGPKQVFDALSDAACTMAVLGVAIAGAGVITSALTVTGLVVAFGGIIKGLAAGSLALLCILLMLTALILGMGVPTTPAYIITAALGAPLLTEMGVAPIAAHLFMLYFAVLADATPPVAVASFAAAAIAKCDPLAAGMQALRFALAGFVVGYGFIYDPGIMLRAPLIDTIVQSGALAASLVLIGAGMGGFFRDRLALWARGLALALGLLVAFGQAMPDWTRLATGLGAVGLFMAIPVLFAPRPALAR